MTGPEEFDFEDGKIPPWLADALKEAPLCNRIPGRSAAEANLNGAPHGFRATGDAAWDSDSADYAMFSDAGNQAVASMVKTARLKSGTEDEAGVETWLAAERRRIRPEHPEVADTMVRETIAYALDETWEAAYGSRYEGVLSRHDSTAEDDGESPS
jgi:hypothetical protein